MKKLVMICVVLTLALCCITASARDIEIYMFGELIESDVPPVIEDGRTLVPVRAITESGMGADVKWNDKKKQATVTKDDMEILFTIGKKEVLVNDKKEYLDVPAKIISGRTMIPVRFVSETFDYDVMWDDVKSRVTIDEKNEYGTIDDIEVEKTKNDNLVNVEMSELEKPNMFTLKEPYRIVLDFTKTKFDGHDGKINVDSGYITQVRWADHDGYYRIVIECPGEQPYKYVKTGAKSFSVVVGNKSTAVDIDNDKVEDKDDEEDIKDTEDSKKEESKDEEIDENYVKPEDRDILVVIDAGHGGKDPGALGRDEEGEIIYEDDESKEVYIKEKDINLAVAKKVYKYLKDKKINVIMTRDKDEYLELREIADIANDANATLFVSIHSNSVDAAPDVNGMEVLYYDTDGKKEFGVESKKMADIILNSALYTTDMTDRGIKERPGLAVLKWTDMPAVLVELGFVTNADDQEKLIDSDWQADAAWGISQGIIKVVKQQEKALDK